MTQPLDLTTSVKDISVTERNSFKQCRRRWYLETLENLEPRGQINWAFAFGTGVHAGLEAFYKACGDIIAGDPLEEALDAFEEWYEETDTKILQADLGMFESGVRNELLHYRELGVGILNNYNEFAVLNDNFTVCCVEGKWTQEGLDLLGEFSPPYGEDAHPTLHESGRLLVPIVDPGQDHEVLDSTPLLSAKLDLIVYSKEKGLTGFWVHDHKTTSSSPSDRGIDMDDQVTGYSYVFWRLTGIAPRGTTFNYLVKHLPKEPRETKTGLSYAKDQITTPEWYREALVEHGLLVKGRITSDNHAACYSSLLAHGWDRFFKRMSVQRNEHELMMFEYRLVQEYWDMLTVYKNPGEKAYPFLSQYNCPGCPVMPICQAIEDGSDYEEIIEHKFQQAEDRKAVVTDVRR